MPAGNLRLTGHQKLNQPPASWRSSIQGRGQAYKQQKKLVLNWKSPAALPPTSASKEMMGEIGPWALWALQEVEQKWWTEGMELGWAYRTELLSLLYKWGTTDQSQNEAEVQSVGFKCLATFFGPGSRWLPHRDTQDICGNRSKLPSPRLTSSTLDHPSSWNYMELLG